MRGMLVKNMDCLEANNDSPIIEHREGLLILRAGEIAQKACQILLHVTAGHVTCMIKELLGWAGFVRNPLQTTKHQNQTNKQKEKKKQAN